MRKSIIYGRKPFITTKQKTGENDLHKLLGNDCGYNEGMVSQAWVHKWASIKLQWLVLRIGGTDFLHCWVVDSILLEHADNVFMAAYL